MTALLSSDLDANSNIDCITYIVSTTVAITKGLCITASQKKLGININAAIDDWLSANKETKKIMKKYAVRTNILTLTLLYTLFVCLALYLFAVAMLNVKQIFFTDENSVDGNIRFIVPLSLLT